MIYVETADVPFNYIICQSRYIHAIDPVLGKDIKTGCNTEAADLIRRIPKSESLRSWPVRPEIACIKLMDLKSGDIIDSTNP